ncbi:hypothetical protein GGF46_003712 [Coemansia sp. RSA 552]|nr:hypothetical protein GGF46_003712 [Coemansia sp. RSA 552]
MLLTEAPQQTANKGGRRRRLLSRRQLRHQGARVVRIGSETVLEKKRGPYRFAELDKRREPSQQSIGAMSHESIEPCSLVSDEVENVSSPAPTTLPPPPEEEEEQQQPRGRRGRKVLRLSQMTERARRLQVSPTKRRMLTEPILPRAELPPPLDLDRGIQSFAGMATPAAPGRRPSAGHHLTPLRSGQSRLRPRHRPAALPAESDVEVSERCAAHPGSRNTLWCETCEAAVCEHCAGHTGHSVERLLAVYDDTFEAVEAMQLAMVRRLTETRQRNALLDASLVELASAYERGLQALERGAAVAGRQMEQKFCDAQAELEARKEESMRWRSLLEETLQTVQGMAEELPPAQMVARRGRILGLLDAVERARPIDWDQGMPQNATAELEALGSPTPHVTALYVPSVLELGRRRGHVRVASDVFSAHGMTWQLEARRGRGDLGDACLSITATCVTGLRTSAYEVGVHVVEPEGSGDQAQRHFEHHSKGRSWHEQATHEFSVAALSKLDSAGLLDKEGGVTVQFSVCPETFCDLADVQAARILALEQRVRDLEVEQQSGDRSTADQPGSLRPTRRRRNNSQADWLPATSPRAPRSGHPEFVHMRKVAEPSPSPRQGAFSFDTKPQSPVLPPQSSFTFDADKLRGLTGGEQWRQNSQPAALVQKDEAESPTDNRRRANSQALRRSPPQIYATSPMRISKSDGSRTVNSEPRPSTLQGPAEVHDRHRRAMSMTTRLRRQQSPVPHPLNMSSSSNSSQTSFYSQLSDNSRMLRRLSGWVKTTEGRVAQQAKRVRQQLVKEPKEEFEEWTLLDKSLSPGFPTGEYTAATLGPAERLSSPSPRDETGGDSDVNANSDDDDGFAFDGKADVEREQAKVDERARQQQQLDSIMQRMDALQLIANTVENSRDGFTEGTLRRISSEIGVLVDGRKRRIAEARFGSGPRRPEMILGLGERQQCLSRPQTSDGRARRSLSMDPAEIDRALDRVGIDPLMSTPTVVVGRKKSATVTADQEMILAGHQLVSPTLSTSGRCPVTPPPPYLPSVVDDGGSLGGSINEVLTRSLEELDVSTGQGSLFMSPDLDRSSDSISSSGSLAKDDSPSPCLSELSAGPSPTRLGRGRSPARISRSGTLSVRRSSSGSGANELASASCGIAAAKLGSLQKQRQLTPQADRRGGILKPGRTRRDVLPARQQHSALLPPPPPLLADPEKPAANLELIGIHTPHHGPGRFTEYVADNALLETPTQSQSAAAKQGRSATLPPLQAGRVPAKAEATPTAGRDNARQVRSARAARKRVRFPEEQRLLETIRLIDPQVARSIESRAAEVAKTTSPEARRRRSPLPQTAPLPPPMFDLSQALAVASKGGDKEEDGEEAVSGLAARVRSSPRLSPRKPTQKDEDSLAMNSGPPSSDEDDKFATASSVFFSKQMESPTKIRRRPPMPMCLASSVGSAQQARNRTSTVITDESVMSPTLSSMAAAAKRQMRYGRDETIEYILHSGQRNYRDNQRSVKAQSMTALPPPPPPRYRINARGLAVGPNTGSNPSSPVSTAPALGSANCSSSSSPSPPAGRQDVLVFGNI